ncbi:unnamed protein product, partial [Hapterophycus canaliculatus]
MCVGDGGDPCWPPAFSFSPTRTVGRQERVCWWFPEIKRTFFSSDVEQESYDRSGNCDSLSLLLCGGCSAQEASLRYASSSPLVLIYRLRGVALSNLPQLTPCARLAAPPCASRR